MHKPASSTEPRRRAARLGRENYPRSRAYAGDSRPNSRPHLPAMCRPRRTCRIVRRRVLGPGWLGCFRRAGSIDSVAVTSGKIEFRDVRKLYQQGRRQIAALDGATLLVEPGEFVAVTGPSGSGKSTLLHLAGALDLPTSGQVLIDGRDSSQMSDDDLSILRRQHVGFVFQFFNLIPTLSVLENTALPGFLSKRGRAEVTGRAESLLERVGLNDRAAHLPEELSGGEMQRVAIARALINDPQLLLADEPTGNLDSATGAQILDLLRELQNERTIVIVTHDAGAARVARRTIRLKDGRIE